MRKIVVCADGDVLVHGHSWKPLAREAARFVLRRLYEERERRAKGARTKAFEGWVLDSISLDRSCTLSTCGKPISERRVLLGLENDNQTKYCSRRCQERDAQVRFYQRRVARTRKP